MDPKLSKFEAEVDRLINANIAIKNISIYFQKPLRSIYDAIYRINKKKKNITKQERASRGRVLKLSTRTRRAINRDITKSPKKTNSRLIRENNLEVSTRTLQRVLRVEGWTVNICSKKSTLNASRARERLAYAKRQLKELSNIDFKKIIFSDECGVERGHGSRSEYTRKRGNSKGGRTLVSSKTTSTF
jgi:hypothetical protein